VKYHGLHNGAKSLIIIDAGRLHEPAKNPAGLVPLECPIGLELILEYPLTGDNIGAAEHGTKSQVSLDRRVAYSSSIAPANDDRRGRPKLTLGRGGEWQQCRAWVAKSR
jgi:hypothetical protein